MRDVGKLDKQWLEFENWEDRVKALDLPYYDNPKTDNDRLINSQYRFITSGFRDQKAEAEIWEGSYKICMNLIKKEAKKNNLRFDEIEREIKAGIATDYVCRRYRMHLNDNNEIYVIKNFIVQLSLAVKHALYHPGENDLIMDSTISLDQADQYRRDID